MASRQAPASAPGERAGAHWYEEHVSEVEVGLQAPSLAGLFVEAALALAELQAGQPLPAGEEPRELVRLEATDRDALLVDWLNELLYRSEVNQRIYATFRIDQLSGEGLTAAIGRAGDARPRPTVKAATFHGLHIAQTPEGFTARVVFDV